MRITGGSHRSRSLRAPKGDRTRPTSDRVREALFSILRDVSGDRVLDLYAGTGALALEALSRGAEHATFVEEGRDALAALRYNIEQLDVGSRTTVLPMSVERAARALVRTVDDERFTLVFADPPYRLIQGGEFVQSFEPIIHSGGIASDATVVVEHASADPPPTVSDLELLESRRYGDTTLSLYLYRSRI
ncbi:16S rRNA (guanine(966)-N(2))-methyltransferase RsmD [Pendulispora brunnea]|uniref:16S rRNA (Guanine(966)-N(2))-methyltransferase RsmD n=1 Tax=Pendulispora brunnea TaxID=2905690 RepID=A0ABZ2K8P5_9BACT